MDINGLVVLGVPDVYLYFYVNDDELVYVMAILSINDKYYAVSIYIVMSIKAVIDSVMNETLWEFYKSYRYDWQFMFVETNNVGRYKLSGGRHMDADRQWIYKLVESGESKAIAIDTYVGASIIKLSGMRPASGDSIMYFAPFYDESSVRFHNRIHSSPLAECTHKFVGVLRDAGVSYGAIYELNSNISRGTEKHIAEILYKLHSRGILIGDDDLWHNGKPVIALARFHPYTNNGAYAIELFKMMINGDVSGVHSALTDKLFHKDDNGRCRNITGAYRLATIGDILSAIKSTKMITDKRKKEIKDKCADIAMMYINGDEHILLPVTTIFNNAT